MPLPKRTYAARTGAAPPPRRVAPGKVPCVAFLLFAGFAGIIGTAPVAARETADAAGAAAFVDTTARPQPADSAPAAVSPNRAKTAPAPVNVELYDIRDRDLLLQLWAYTGSTNEPDPGSWQVMLLRDTTQHGWLLHEGTQVAPLPGNAIDWIRRESRAAAREGRLTRTRSDGFWTNFWNPEDPLEPYQWPTGLELSMGMEGTAFRRATMQNVKRMDVTFTQRPWTWLTMEAGGHFERHMGGLRRNLTNPLDSLPGWNAWDVWRPWWHVAIGVPGLLWEVSESGRMFPEFYWLDPEAAEGTYQNGRRRAGVPVDTSEGFFADGAVVRAWRDGGPTRAPRGNLAQTLHVRAGQLRYAVTFDPDVYRAPIHQFLVEEIIAPFGQWSVGFTTAAGHGYTRLGLALFPYATRTGPGAPDRSVRGHLLHLNLDYRDVSAFRIAASTRIRIDSPRFRPGGLQP